MLSLAALFITTLLSWALTAGIRRYALARSLLDIPNARSSHTLPTPRGGGVAIAASYLLAVVGMAAQGGGEWSLASALLGAGIWIAALGFLDDHAHIAARWRLLNHFIAATWVLFWVGGVPPLELLGSQLYLGWVSYPVAAIGLVWLLNLYNFMDGIDGIASIEAVSLCIGAAFLYWIGGYAELVWGPLLLASAVLGFLYWNFPPARIFMGDAGSGFLGITLGTLALHAGWVDPNLLWGWLILLGVFLVDATYTLLHRLIRGERIYEAHCSHAYQLATRHYGGHMRVVLAVAALNLLWLLPIGVLVVLQRMDGWVGLLLAYVPLIILARRFRAGASG